MTAVAFVAGLIFALGLGFAGMTQPARVIGFLDFAGDWDPTLAFVMGSAVLTSSLLFALARRRSTPLLAGRFEWPTRTDLDGRLIAGAAVFGIGWGLAGYCPGPAIVSLPSGGVPVIVFVACLWIGLRIGGRLAGALPEKR